MSSIFGGGGGGEVFIPPPPPPPPDPEVEFRAREKARKQRLIRAQAAGRRTILTSPLGVPTAGQTRAASILGGS